jgi:hypothetical protein
VHRAGGLDARVATYPSISSTKQQKQKTNEKKKGIDKN